MLDCEQLEKALQTVGRTQEPFTMSMLSALLPTSTDRQCAYCNKRYTQLSNLRRHVKGQHLGYRFSCRRCEAETLRREDLIKHYEAAHPEEVEEAETQTEVCKVMPDGQVVPLGKSGRKGRPRRCSLRVELTSAEGASGGKKSRRLMERKLNTPLRSRELQAACEALISPPTLEASLPAEARLVPEEEAAEPQRVIIALDPVSQFRLERVIADRVDRITERSVVETLDKVGRVTRRETVEREYFLNSYSSNGQENSGAT